MKRHYVLLIVFAIGFTSGALVSVVDRDKKWKQECSDRGVALYYEDVDYFMWIKQKQSSKSYGGGSQ